ncbi:hypothetical protein EUGRSUZ_G02133 [Eucalyptus grandis]|uniref:Uncharacterized protein n=2 Tax=Eucalyptus grandis TaxID=71139 RepID=A0ACC3K4T6_EUCGR|nr:hypothetical protein EUGRSUZ_G02133 [Eucalyptus grandis]
MKVDILLISQVACHFGAPTSHSGKSRRLLITGIRFMPCARSYLHSDRLVDRVRLLLLLLLPHQDETAIPAARESLRRLLSPFLLRICALTQEYCELEKRGFDMSIGWYMNMKRQNRGIPMAPVPPGGMMR